MHRRLLFPPSPSLSCHSVHPSAFGAPICGGSLIGTAASPSNTHRSGASGGGRRRSPASAAAAAAAKASPYGSGGGSGPGSGSDASGTAYGEDDLIRGTRNNDNVINGGSIIIGGRAKNPAGGGAYGRMAGDRRTSNANTNGSIVHSVNSSSVESSHANGSAVAATSSSHGSGTTETGTTENQVKWAWPGTATTSATGPDGMRRNGASTTTTARGTARTVSSKALPLFTPGSGGESGSDLHGKVGGRGSDIDSSGMLGAASGDRSSGISDRDRTVLGVIKGGGGIHLARRAGSDSSPGGSDRRSSAASNREDIASKSGLPKGKDGIAGAHVTPYRGGGRRTGAGGSPAEYATGGGGVGVGSSGVSPSDIRKRSSANAPRSPR